MIATYLFKTHQVVAVKDLADLLPETVHRIALTLNLGEVPAPKFIDACAQQRKERARRAAFD